MEAARCRSPRVRSIGVGLPRSTATCGHEAYVTLRIPAPGVSHGVDGAEPRAAGRTHRLAEVLPGGKAVLFVIGTTMIESFDEASIAVLSLVTGEYRVVLSGGTNPHYSRSGHLVFTRAGTSWQCRLIGDPAGDRPPCRRCAGRRHIVKQWTCRIQPFAERFAGLRAGARLGIGPTAAVGGSIRRRRRSSTTRARGRNRGSRPMDVASRLTPTPRSVMSGSPIWSASMARLTMDGYNNGQPLWAPDSAHVAFLRAPPDGGRSDAVLQPADGSQPATRLTTGGPGEFGPSSPRRSRARPVVRRGSSTRRSIR